MKNHVALLIEDNTTIAEQVIEFFANHNWTVDYASGGQLGIKLATQNIYDVVILDLNLPDIDGLDVCTAIKQQARVDLPVIMLTARDSIDDKISGLATGADDYLSKPFNLRELIMRCKALARRHQLHKSRKIKLGELEIDLHHSQFSIKQQNIAFTPTAGLILSTLAQHYPNPVSRSNLLHNVWGDSPPDSDALKAHIYGLRRTLHAHTNSLVLVTVPHLGYRLEITKDEEVNK